ncbi:VCBS domain-containing protein, partial [Sulfurimonas sp.]|uniref:VCBS domain-containing protein n=1 Tax=Sulfurimonas sp. TaxID=2022749 RepID=UPI002634CF72
MNTPAYMSNPLHKRVVGKVELNSSESGYLKNVEIVEPDGTTRPIKNGTLVYEGDQISSQDDSVSFDIKYFAHPEPTEYSGVFTVLVDSSVYHVANANEQAINSTPFNINDTATGNEPITTYSTPFFETETNLPTDDSPVNQSPLVQTTLTSRTILAEEATTDTPTAEREPLLSPLQQGTPDSTAPVITSEPIIVYDENNTAPVIQVTSTDASNVTYSLENGLDSALFTLNDTTGTLSFIQPPNYEHPLDQGSDNQYNVNITATDTHGNSTTETLSIYINNINDQPIVNNVDITVSEDSLTSIPDDSGINVLSYSGTLNVNDEDTTDTHTFSKVENADLGLTVTLPQTDSHLLSLYQAAQAGSSTAFSALQGAFENVLQTSLATALLGSSNTLTTLAQDIQATTNMTELNNVLTNSSVLDLSEVQDANGNLTAIDIALNADAAQTAGLEEAGALTITVAPDGTYTIVSPLLDSLGATESAQITFAYNATDSSGAANATSEVATVTVEVTGTNDAPVVLPNSTTTAALTEDTDTNAVAMQAYTATTTTDTPDHTYTITHNGGALMIGMQSDSFDTFLKIYDANG